VASLLLIDAGAGGVEIEDPAVVVPDGVEVWEGGRPVLRPDTPKGQVRPATATAATAGVTAPDDLLVVRALYPPMFPEESVARVRGALAALGAVGVAARAVPAADWAEAWKSHFRVIKVTSRLVVRPAWEQYQAGPGEVVVSIDPGLAFGTGTHPTTLLCLRLLEEARPAGQRVLDVGTGSGILAIAAALFGAGPVLAVDPDPLAVKAARRNVLANGVGDRVTVELGGAAEALGGPAAAGRTPPWDGALLNVATDLAVAFAAGLRRTVRQWAVVSGYPVGRRSEVAEALTAVGWDEARSTWLSEGGWGAVLVRKSP
jgi:ribosomal protein L11 methyltransferase